MSRHSRSDKTFIGRIERGFDFLGYHFGPEGLTMAAKTIEQFIERAIRLYEQKPGEALASARLGLYVRRWFGWATAVSKDKRRPAPMARKQSNRPVNLWPTAP